MNRPLKRIYLDFDGTLNDATLRVYESYSIAIRKLGGIPVEYTTFLLNKRSGSPKEELLSQSKVDPSQIDKFDRYIFDLIETDSIILLDCLFAWSKDFLRSLVNLGFELCLLSSRQRSDLLYSQITRYSIEKYFSNIFVEKDKKSFLVSKNNRFTWFIIGDTEAEIIAAKESKIPCISVTWGMRSEKFLLDLHPEYIANNVQELLSIIKNEYYIQK